MKQLSANVDEFKENGYQILRGRELKEFIKCYNQYFGADIYVGAKTTVLGVFDFKAFLNMAMLLSESEKARALRQFILDVVIDLINRKTGGGTYEHFDLGRLESVLYNIQNNDYYPTFVDKLTHLFFCVCEFHCFADGNKRLAITLSTQFLLLNGYMGVAKNFMSITENISYQVAAGKIDKIFCIEFYKQL